MFNISDSGRRNTVNLGRIWAHLHSHSPMVQNSVLRPLPNKSIKFEIYLRGRTTFCVGEK